MPPIRKRAELYFIDLIPVAYREAEAAASPACLTSVEEHWLACWEKPVFKNTAATSPARLPSNRQEYSKR